jgi:hypothetical protein
MKFETLRECIEHKIPPSKRKAPGLSALQKQYAKLIADMENLRGLIETTCTHANLEVKKEYREDDWARQSWYEYEVSCVDCKKYFGTIVADTKFRWRNPRCKIYRT